MSQRTMSFQELMQAAAAFEARRVVLTRLVEHAMRSFIRWDWDESRTARKRLHCEIGFDVEIHDEQVRDAVRLVQALADDAARERDRLLNLQFALAEPDPATGGAS